MSDTTLFLDIDIFLFVILSLLVVLMISTDVSVCTQFLKMHTKNLKNHLL